MASVRGLGHVGVYVKDLEKMTEFYTNFMGLTITDRGGENDNLVFLSAQPEREHHELLLMDREPPGEIGAAAFQQLSFVVGSWPDLQEFHRRLVKEEYKIEFVVNHGIAIGCYFRDPEENVVEVYWPTGHDYRQPCAEPIEMDLSEAEVLKKVHELPSKEASDQPRYYGDASPTSV